MKKKVSFQLLVELRRRYIVREGNEIEKNENESEDGVVGHSKVQALESRKICQKFWALGAVHKVCHAFFDDFWPPPSPCHKLSQILDPPLKVCHTSEQKVNKQISRMETALNNYTILVTTIF